MEIEMKHIAAASNLGMGIEEYLDYKNARILALELELKKTKAILEEIATVSTDIARDVKVILKDPNFNKPLSEIETNYEIIKK